MHQSQFLQMAMRFSSLVAVCIVVGGIFLCESASFRRTNSSIYDEPFYFVNAVRVFRNGDFKDLTNGGVAPLPVLVNYFISAKTYADIAAQRVSEQTVPLDDAISLSRLTATWMVGIPLVLTVIIWTYRWTGSVIAGGIAGALLIFSPNCIAHMSLATTDACLTLFYVLALAGIGWFAERPTLLRALFTGLLIGLALASKYSGVILLGISFICCVFCELVNNRADPIRNRIARVMLWHPMRHVLLTIMAFFTCWALTGFSMADPLFNKPASATGPGQGLRRIFGTGPFADRAIDYLATHQQPAVITSFLQQLRATQYGNKVLINGEVFDGHPLYYLYGLLWKSTLVELLLVAVVMLASGYHIYRACLGRHKANMYEIAIVLGAAILFLASSLSLKQLGLRYILPLYPIVFISGVSACATIWQNRPSVRLLLAVGVIAWQATTLYFVWPYPLSYFNSLAGGPPKGIGKLGDSDSDWGQGLIALRDYMHEQGTGRVLLFPFEWVSPDGEYGVWTHPTVRYDTPPCRYIAISSSAITAAKFNKNALANFEAVPPSFVVGHTYLIYETSDPVVWQTYLQVVSPQPKQP